MTSRETSKPMCTTTIWLLILTIVVLAIVPLFLHPGSEFGGADGAAEGIITTINPDVEPWFEPLWEPPGGETESLLFALQAAIGAGVIGYFFGLKRGERRYTHGNDSNE
ncbi:MAG: energy-coupling factor ABC transporter substrate-binding protein [Chloroflexi bacterium AL-W]|nr:energy-coupling factor ABC transporter substrate-binding protein [Chloroflexi bacterium AL-N1]NOK71519.1 energy-coupling factor ABC transporter substrate-binding protein [Chloroflexi bacterium AL-N10]NOK78865.1 energy-coupling factor ABC transporter substrate-binding protein [Chloroflexi bacterium AL-N5]NOK86341.1 energy-coupling factor ABC transporter substrate-binding protein [Chloroflexi bacterium AL-W]NOK93310.1 energy-coupling factor ABC transporter substrate-binding protein [Chloroflex